MCHYDNDCYVDGSIICNYPFRYFKDINNILGFLIESSSNNSDIKRIDDFTVAIINCLIQKDVDFNKKIYKDQTININVNINSLNFNLSKKEKETLFDTGYNNTITYLQKQYDLFTLDIQLQSEIQNHKYLQKNI